MADAPDTPGLDPMCLDKQNMIMWPYDAKSTGFSTTPKKTGTRIMWAGTPYAHLMINQKP